MGKEILIIIGRDPCKVPNDEGDTSDNWVQGLAASFSASQWSAPWAEFNDHGVLAMASPTLVDEGGVGNKG